MSRQSDTNQPPGIGVRALLFSVLILFALAPLAVSNAWGHRETQRFLTEAAARNAANVAALEASRSDEFVRERRMRLAALAETAALLHRGGDEVASLLISATRAEPRGTRFWWFTAAGAVVGNARDSQPPPPACLGGAAVAEFLSGGREPTLVLRHGLPDRAGAACGAFPFEVHHEFVADSGERLQGARITLLDAAGATLCGSAPGAGDGHEHGRHAHVEPTAARRLNGEPILADGTSWTRRGDDAQGAPVLASMAPLASIPAGVLAEVPLSSALAPLARLTRRAVALSSLLSLVLVVVVGAVSRRLTHPLLQLSSAADVLAQGHLGTRLVPSGPRELRQVARGFNSMARDLADAQALLEQRIEERTAELEESRAFVELLFDSIDHEVRVFGPDLVVLKTNRHASRNGSGAGTPCHQRCGEARECDSCPVRRVFSSGRPASTERTQERSGATDIVRSEAWPVVGGGGGVRAVVEITQVVTGEKQMTAQLLHREKMAALGLVTAGIAHEIGNPLSGILAEAARGQALDDADALQEVLATVEGEARRMSRLLRELVDFSRRRRNVAALVSVNQAVEDVVRLLGHDPRSRGVTVGTTLGEALPPIRAKEDHLIQVLLNLGLNALDAVEGCPARTVHFETDAREGQVHLRVRDSGPGVPLTQRARIFQPFWTSKGNERGTGLGLFLSRDVVEGLGGSLDLESGLAGDCCFLATLPVADDREGEA